VSLHAGPRKVVFISQAPTPYLTPILNCLARVVDLDVLFFRRPGTTQRRNEAWSEFDDPWGEAPQFRHSFARSVLVHEPRTDFHVQLAAGAAWRFLVRRDPAAVIVHGWGPLVLEPILWASRRNRARILWTESHSRSGLFRSGVSNAIRRLIIRRADMIVSNGSLATDYAVELGADPRRIISSCLPSRLRTATSAPDRAETRIRFLFVGRLVELKRAHLAVEAFGALARGRSDVELVIVGSGPDEAMLRSRAAPYGARIVFAGRLEQERLREAYEAADVLLVPSVREVWGLVVNEGLAAGLYVVAASGVGSASDLIDLDAGEIVAGDDVLAWSAALARAADIDRSESARERRRARVANCTPERFAADFHRAIESALAHRPVDGR
jgi:glycosyltransferase involved in cell wall biosynthesis